MEGFSFNNTLYEPPIRNGVTGPLVFMDSDGFLFRSATLAVHFHSRDCGSPCIGSSYVLTMRTRKRDASDVILWGEAEFTPMANPMLGTE
jgi:hypothetical protein